MTESAHEAISAFYPMTYRDRLGSESVELAVEVKSGQTQYRTVLRGVEFAGSDFDMLEPAANPAGEIARKFGLWRGCLSACEFELAIPMILFVGDQFSETTSRLRLKLADPVDQDHRHGVRTTVAFELTFQGVNCQSGDWEALEIALQQVQQQMPPGTYMKICFNCAFSDYSPAGQGLSGMHCFRRNKPEYRSARNKTDFLQLPAQCRPELVPEIYLCPEFERRTPGTGYRG
jgi:Family of unknown function (DUF6304)